MAVRAALRTTRSVGCSSRCTPSLASWQPQARAVGPAGQLRTMSSEAPLPHDGVRFSTFDVSSQVFLSRPQTVAIVNLKPIVPLHVLVIPRTLYARVGQVPREELHQLFDAVQDVSNVVQELTGATSCTISIQDGKDAGQSVPHVHVHILPRKVGDFSPNDAIYAQLDSFGLGLQRDMQQQARRQHDGEEQPPSSVPMDASEDRAPRSMAEMVREAEWLKKYF